MRDTWVEGAGWRLYRGRFQEAIASLPDDYYDHIITDPPFSVETHDGALTTVGDDDEAKLIDFDHLTDDEMREHMELLARVCKRWWVATMEWRHVAALEKHPPAGWRFVRMGVWVKPSYKPQISGDRPATGWEAIGIFHRDAAGRPRRMRWNGGGKSAVYTGNKTNDARWPTQKPLWLMRQFLKDFADRGDRVFDPYGGSGTMSVAALLERMRPETSEMNPEGWTIIESRLAECQPEGTEARLLVQKAMF
jgi:site-specific DNA-methyltransferase (adenine-specific)